MNEHARARALAGGVGLVSAGLLFLVLSGLVFLASGLVHPQLATGSSSTVRIPASSAAVNGAHAAGSSTSNGTAKGTVSSSGRHHDGSNERAGGHDPCTSCDPGGESDGGMSVAAGPVQVGVHTSHHHVTVTVKAGPVKEKVEIRSPVSLPHL